jgi:hypothetical protein
MPQLRDGRNHVRAREVALVIFWLALAVALVLHGCSSSS